MKVFKEEQEILSNVSLADTFLKRSKGLLGTEVLSKGEGLLITPCNSIHMFFMKYPIDVLFLNDEGKVVGMVKNIRPWRASKIYFKATMTLEMSSGLIDEWNIQCGDLLKFIQN